MLWVSFKRHPPPNRPLHRFPLVAFRLCTADQLKNCTQHFVRIFARASGETQCLVCVRFDVCACAFVRVCRGHYVITHASSIYIFHKHVHTHRESWHSRPYQIWLPNECARSAVRFSAASSINRRSNDSVDSLTVCFCVSRPTTTTITAIAVPPICAPSCMSILLIKRTPTDRIGLCRGHQMCSRRAFTAKSAQHPESINIYVLCSGDIVWDEAGAARKW